MPRDMQCPSPWVLLYNKEQHAYHIEPLVAYRLLPTNGYHIVQLCETYDEASCLCAQLQGILA